MRIFSVSELNQLSSFLKLFFGTALLLAMLIHAFSHEGTAFAKPQLAANSSQPQVGLTLEATQHMTSESIIGKMPSTIIHGLVKGVEQLSDNLAIQLVAENGSIVAQERVFPDGSYQFPPVLRSAYQLRLVNLRGDEIALFEDGQHLVFGDLSVEQHILTVDTTQLVIPQSTNAAEKSPIETVLEGKVIGLSEASGGVSVQLIDANGAIIAKTPTTGDGYYRFVSLPKIESKTGLYLRVVSKHLGELPLSATSNSQVYLDEGKNDPTLIIDLQALMRQQSLAENTNRNDLANAPNTDQAIEATGAIAGVVTDAATGKGLRFVDLYVYTSTNAYEFDTVTSAFTNDFGEYELTGLSTGIYYVRARPDFAIRGQNFLDEYYNNKYWLAEAEPVQVTANATTADINFALDKSGALTGHLTSVKDGASIGGVQVAIYTSTAAPYFYNFVHTDKRGIYTFTRLPPHDYYLEFQGGIHQQEYYNNKSTLTTADPIQVALNSTTTVDAVLDRLGAISGRVTDANSNLPIPDARISIYTSTLSSTPIGESAADEQGNFSSEGLEPGNYFLEFSVPYFLSNIDYISEFFDNQPTQRQATTVTVSLNTTTANINASLEKAGKIVGRVTAAESNLPLAGVHINIYGPPKESVDECGNTIFTTYINGTSTDANGNYEVRGLRGGTYLVQFETRFSSNNTTRRYLETSKTNIVVTSGNSTTVDAALQFGSVIRGRVTAFDTGMPIALAFADIYAKTDEGVGDYLHSTVVDANGFYTSSGLSSGQYYVLFGTYQVNNASRGYISEWYNDKSNIGTATPINLTGGVDVNNIDAVLAVGGRLRGKVTSVQSGQPIRQVRVTANLGKFDVIAGALTDAQGVYTITGLPTGSYKVRFQSSFADEQSYAYEFYNNTILYSQAVSVAVTAGNDTDNIDAALADGGRINGIVIAADTKKPLATYVNAVDSEGNYFRYARSNSESGQYSISGLPSSLYHVEFDPTTIRVQCAIASYSGLFYNQQADLGKATPVSVNAPYGVNNINAALPISGTSAQPLPNLAVLTGQVVNTATQPLSNIHIHLFRSIASGTNSSWRSAGFATTGEDGRYEITGLAEGNYRVRFVDPSSQHMEEYFNDASTLDTATPISLTTGANASANVQLAKATPPLAQLTSDSGGTQIDTRTGRATVMMPFGQRSSLTVTRRVTCSNGSLPTMVKLQVVKATKVLHEYIMTQGVNGVYQATIPEADLENGTEIVVVAVCTVEEKVVVGVLVLYDPSGIVTDKATGTPVPGAIVTLYNVPGWRARTSATDNESSTCESNASKLSDQDWTQIAPTDLGSIALATSGVISPAINPQTTSGIGYYGWDVTTGCWYVVIEATGYETRISPIVGVPPAVTDLNVKLDKAGSVKKVYLPVVSR